MQHLLVIDDSLTVRKVVELSFRSADWHLDFAANGADGVSAARRRPPDLILLDFVLPDMKATDVCQRLGADVATSSVPIVLISGNMEKVQPLLGSMPQVVGTVAKPFSAAHLVETIQQSARPPTRPAKVESSRLKLSFRQREMAANALFERLRPAFNRIPEWAREAPAASAAQFFARKLLTPDLMTQLLEALIPVYQEILGSGSRLQVEPEKGEVTFQGTISEWPLEEVLRFLESSRRSGEFQLEADGRTHVLYLRKGEVILVTCLDAERYAQGSSVKSKISDALRRKAEVEQCRTGKPVYVSFAEAGELPDCDVAAELFERSKSLLLELAQGRSARFSWRERSALPLFVDAYGKRLSLEQLPLEKLRLERPFEEADRVLPSNETVFERAPGFTRQLHRLDLNSAERLVLALIDGKRDLQDIIGISGLVEREARLVVHRLLEVQLLRKLDAEVSGAVGAPPVMVKEPDIDGFQRPLAELLARRAVPVELIPLPSEENLLASVLRFKPCLLLYNATSDAERALKLARAVRESVELSDTALVAVLDSYHENQAEQLGASGFDIVLHKPVSYTDIERFLTLRQ